MRSTLTLGILCLWAIQWMGCSTGKVVAYFMPSGNDYQKVFKVDTISTNNTPSDVWLKSDTNITIPNNANWLDPYFSDKNKTLEELLNSSGTTSFIVMRNDSILYEKYFNGHGVDQQQIVFSVGKTVTSSLVAIAIEEGLMDMDQSIADFIPAFRNDDRNRIKVKHLLNMTSGIKWMDHKDLIRLSLFYYSFNAPQFVIKHTPLKYNPGTHFSYKSISTQILGMCLEAATGKKTSEYLEEKIWKPMGMEYDAYMTLDSKKNGNSRNYGGIALTSRDLMRYGCLFLNNGKWKNKQILPKKWVDQIREREIEVDKWWGYTYCWWRNGYIEDNFLEGNDFFAAGFKKQYLYVNPKYNMIIIRTGDQRKNNPDWPISFGRLAQYMNEGYNDLTKDSLNFAAQFEGSYETTRGERLDVIYKGIDKKTKQPYWEVWKDVEQTMKMEKAWELKQGDGKSLVYRKFGRQIRLMFEVIDEEVSGLYLDNLFSIDSKYFERVSDLPPNRAKKSKTNSSK
ncbi:MAG: beta-lactamase family protein [Saprospiraceae bacterium]|nr:beta-lactamase family protein [Saprospiraceae bacterium]